MPIELACRRCGKPIEPTRDELLKGPAVYTVCAACRPPAPLLGYVAPPAECPGHE